MRKFLISFLVVVIGFLFVSCTKPVTVEIQDAPTSLKVGESVQLVVQIRPTSVEERGVYWSSSAINLASITEDGLLTALNPGYVEITATSKQYSLRYHTIGIDITALDGTIPQIEGVTPIIGDTSVLVTGTQRQFSASVLPATADQTIIWSVDQPELATISSSGLLSAIAEGTILITATSALDSSKYAQLAVTLVLPLEPIEKLEVLSPIEGSLSVTVGQDAVYTTSVTPSDADQAVIWSVDNPTLATISSEGVLHPLAAGTITITATRVLDDTESVSLVVSILPLEDLTPVAVEAVNHISGRVSLTAGESEQYTTSVTPLDADQSIIWSIDHNEIASISASGLLTTTSAGTVKVTATSASDSSIKAEIIITINALEIPVESVSAIIGSNTIKLGNTIQYSTTVLPSSLSQEIAWSVDDVSLATISNSGLLTPLQPGTVKVIATSVLDSSKKAELLLTISLADPVSIVLVGENSLILGNGTSSYQASVLPANASQNVLWSLEGESASGELVAGNYLVTPLSAGTVILTVKSAVNNEILNTLSIQISLPPAISLEISTFSHTLIVNEQVNISVSVLPSLASQAFTISSTNSGIVNVVDSSIIAISIGEATITITSSSNPTVSQSITINVVNLDDRMSSFFQTLSQTEHKITEISDLGFIYASEVAYLADAKNSSKTDQHVIGYLYSDANGAWNAINYDRKYGMMGYAAFGSTYASVNEDILLYFTKYEQDGIYELNGHGTINVTNGVFLNDIELAGGKDYLHLEFDLTHLETFLAFYGTNPTDYDTYFITLGHPDELNALEGFAPYYDSGFVIGQLTQLLIGAIPASNVTQDVCEAVPVPNPEKYGYRLSVDAIGEENQVFVSPQLMSITAIGLDSVAYNASLAASGYPTLNWGAGEKWYIFYIHESETYGYAIRAEDTTIYVRPIIKKESEDPSIFSVLPVYPITFLTNFTSNKSGIIIAHSGLEDVSYQIKEEYGQLLENAGWNPVFTVNGWEYHHLDYDQAVLLITETDALHIRTGEVSEVPLDAWPTAFVSEQYSTLETALSSLIPALPTNLSTYRFSPFESSVLVILLENTESNARAIYNDYINILLGAGWTRIATYAGFKIQDPTKDWELNDFHYNHSLSHISLSFRNDGDNAYPKVWPDFTPAIGTTIPEFPILGDTYGYVYYLPCATNHTDIVIYNYEYSDQDSDYLAYLVEYLNLLAIDGWHILFEANEYHDSRDTIWLGAYKDSYQISLSYNRFEKKITIFLDRSISVPVPPTFIEFPTDLLFDFNPAIPTAVGQYLFLSAEALALWTYQSTSYGIYGESFNFEGYIYELGDDWEEIGNLTYALVADPTYQIKFILIGLSYLVIYSHGNYPFTTWDGVITELGNLYTAATSKTKDFSVLLPEITATDFLLNLHSPYFGPNGVTLDVYGYEGTLNDYITLLYAIGYRPQVHKGTGITYYLLKSSSELSRNEVAQVYISENEDGSLHLELVIEMEMAM
jgi:hypothetical protein